MLGDPPGSTGTALGLQPVHQIDRVVVPDPGADPHAGSPDRDGEMRLAGAGAANQHGVALAGQERAGGKIADQALVDRRRGKIEAGNVLGQRQLGAKASFARVRSRASSGI